jgi:uncharacterized membrane protein YuzA (DUF378 family)
MSSGGNSPVPKLDIHKRHLDSAGAIAVRRRCQLGLMGFFGFDLVASIFGSMSLESRIIYALVGVSALYEVR